MKQSKRKSLSRSRETRAIQSQKLQDRIKTGQERNKGKKKGILKDDLDVNRWYPKDGTHIIDIIPYITGRHDLLVEKGDPTYTYECWVHPNVGGDKARYLCLEEMYGEPCPICEERQELRKQGVDETLWKKLYPKRRNLYNVICYDRGEEKKGVQVWDISYHYFEKQVLAIAKKPSRRGGKEKLINFADVENGRSISFSIEPAKSKDDFPSYLGHSFDERDYKIDNTILNSAICLDEAVQKPDYDEVKKVFWSEVGDKKSKKTKSSDSNDSNNDDLEDLLDDLSDLDDMDDLKEFIEENDLDVKIKRKDDEDDVKEKITKALEEEFENEDKDNKKSYIPEKLLDDLDELDDIDDLKEFIEENDLDVKIKRKDDEDDVKEKITKALESKFDDVPF